MDPDKLPPSVLKALIEQGHTIIDIAEMGPITVFSEYCDWEGLIGWGSELWFLVGEIKKAEED